MIGGSIYQKENAFIGGDVIVFGGKYQHERAEPLRSPDKETIMYAGYEEELRSLTQHPAQIFSPALTWSYFAQRLLSTLFWFIISLFLTTIASGAISRAVARFQNLERLRRRHVLDDGQLHAERRTAEQHQQSLDLDTFTRRAFETTAPT